MWVHAHHVYVSGCGAVKSLANATLHFPSVSKTGHEELELKQYGNIGSVFEEFKDGRKCNQDSSCNVIHFHSGSLLLLCLHQCW